MNCHIAESSTGQGPVAVGFCLARALQLCLGMKVFSKIQHRDSRGFTLIELLIVVAIIGVIASIIIPNLLDAMLKAKQKRTMSDMRLLGTSWLSWVTDQAGAMAAGQEVSPKTFNWSTFEGVSASALAETLVPQYASVVPIIDGWGTKFEYGTTESAAAAIPVGIRSAGGDSEFLDDEYVRGPYPHTQYSQDLVWAGGYFIRWPSGLARAQED
jgi:prepilin-type N-terminal cleavage/methylation domain-containing protein